MKKDANITSAGIRKFLKNYDHSSSIAEYIWNGFDAYASEVHLTVESNDLGKITEFLITDNGIGIRKDKINQTFGRFYDSDKVIELQSPKHSSIMHGKNGVGRLTFFTFANAAIWKTESKNNEKYESLEISISESDLKTYSIKDADSKGIIGTTVSFMNVNISRNYFESNVIPYLKKEFAWFLELNVNAQKKLYINQEVIDYSSFICERDSCEFVIEDQTFSGRYIQWNDSLNKEYSKMYMINSNGVEVFKDFTTLNRKGDHFYHSIFITSDFFNDYTPNEHELGMQLSVFSSVKSSSKYKTLNVEIGKYLHSKRKPFLKSAAKDLIENYELSGVLPKRNNSWEELRSNELKESIVGLYEVQPRIFNNLSLDQKKIFVRFLDLLLDSNERDNIFRIIEEVTELDPDERTELSNIFKANRLSRIVSTIKLIQDRYRIYYQLKELVFNASLKANEVFHVQSMIEGHYWLFGEQYNLVTAAEPKFEEALRRYIYEINGNIVDIKIDHPDKNKEMDIFICRQSKSLNKIESIVVELKHPTVLIGEKEYSQLMKYIGVICSKQEFIASNMQWTFYLIGNRFDSTKFIERQIRTNSAHGEESLIFKEDNRIKAYAKTWAEVFNDFEIRHDFINIKLEIERNSLLATGMTANQIITDAEKNTAKQREETKIA
jgi:hypothetical protein